MKRQCNKANEAEGHGKGMARKYGHKVQKHRDSGNQQGLKGWVDHLTLRQSREASIDCSPGKQKHFQCIVTVTKCAL